MTPHLPADCLNEIFECLENKVDVHSCLLVNRLWSRVSVRILWENIRNYNTLIDCLPKESKEILYENEVMIPTKTPIFDYVVFIKNLSINEVCRKLTNVL